MVYRTAGIIGELGLIPVGVGLHQGSSLSPYHFDLIMDVLEEMKDESLWGHAIWR